MVCIVPLCYSSIVLIPRYRTFPALLRTAREEGVGALYKGKIEVPSRWDIKLTGLYAQDSHPRFSDWLPVVVFSCSVRPVQGAQSILRKCLHCLSASSAVVEALSTVFRKSLGPPYV